MEITTITLALPLKMGSVNSYLIGDAGAGYVLIDTGAPNRKDQLEAELARAGCAPGNLRLIVLTHGDFDHTGNAAYLRAKYGAPIAMHEGDLGMAERGDMFWGREGGNALVRAAAPILIGFGKAQRFSPDVCLSDEDDLAAYGLDAQVIAIPGHSKGSIAILTANGALFCGDLLENTKQPALGSIIDNPATAQRQRGEAAGAGGAYGLSRPRSPVPDGDLP